MDSKALFNKPCSFSDVARLQSALDLFAPGSHLSYTVDERGVQITRVLIPANDGYDICLTWEGGQWKPTYQKGGKDLCTMRMAGTNYLYLIEAIRGALSVKNMFWV